MFEVKTIDRFDLTDFAGDVFRTSNTDTPDAILVRSSKVDDSLISKRLLLIARSGTGTNTINVDAATANGTAVFNTPGVNANAVKELIIQNLFRCLRPLNGAVQMMQQLKVAPGEDLQAAAEAKRGDFIGEELYGRTLGILGLGTIGQRLADACYHMGMQIIGYNRSFKNLRHVQQLDTIDEVLEQADFVVILLPLTDQTNQLLSTKQFEMMKDSAYLLNFGRGEIVDNQAVVSALNHNEFAGYVCDFPKTELQDHPKITLLPHLGGNTIEALTHSANLILQNLLDFLEYGTVRSSVNFPRVDLPFMSNQRLTFFFHARDTFWVDVAGIMSRYDLPVQEMMGNTMDGYGYTIVNTDLAEITQQQTQTLLNELNQIDGMIRVRLLNNPTQGEWQ
ncbi:NAD(P)-dependent oxidoreductase [Lentilactobacillus buchneri]|uniref:D-3-phosphoglycerate dehydrogenase n=2 Tax=Lentilactobacillus buchneri TaxID=1581 RepID=J9W4K7_LENBU|nr:NAD(P)-dependent oxidoreductase [Lentilactobacillus buchneri]MCC6101743.1 NAD(P)-binding domain-containing protein [Lactobacillus sp.]WCJ51532.1 NAD(P)-binding domain-containing protein [Lentilactobacillus sp. Egmn17]AEB73073.1 Phosphoglycerate dehydrogenase [Lentilactobacillus buchneri NRRL B-30929]AFR99919.1 D-3-phosphoglycerate dehydrogenase [Lentilactobacillus buchneri subsp. silagei CD034]KRK67104.1 phosphoglycerate dehydrogenase [Lentilactobacillus buchneri DSM 20057]